LDGCGCLGEERREAANGEREIERGGDERETLTGKFTFSL
jgi:hypothetical protein